MKTTTTYLLLGATAIAFASGAYAAEGDALRVCASTKDAPYSTQELNGFENKIAEVLADEMDMPLELVQINNDAIYMFRDGIEDDLCDVLVGIDRDDPRLLASDPYYRSAYAFISREDSNFQGDEWQDIDQEEFKTFAYRYHSPAETILKYTGRYEYNLVYQASLTNFDDRRNKYTQVPADRIISELAAGNADLAIAFAPDIGRYVRDSRTPLKITLITNDIERSDGIIIPLHYDQSVGVTKDKPELLAKVNAGLKTGAARIQAILDEEGIPTLPIEADKTL